MVEKIRATNEAEAHRFLPELFRFRHRVFVEHARWNIPSHRGMEFDQFDTAHAHYLSCKDEEGEVRGLVRLIPTTRPYMIRELWPDLLEQGLVPPVAPDIWEISRFGIDPQADRSTRLQVNEELAIACLEFGLEHGIKEYIAVMPQLIARRSVSDRGWSFTPCGPTQRLGRYRVSAIRLQVSEQALAEVHRRCSGEHAVRPWRSPVTASEPRVGRPLDVDVDVDVVRALGARRSADASRPISAAG